MDPNCWYCQSNGQPYGPYTFEQLREFAREGRLRPQSLVCSVTTRQWIEAGKVPELGVELAKQPLPRPTNAIGSVPPAIPQAIRPAAVRPSAPTPPPPPPPAIANSQPAAPATPTVAADPAEPTDPAIPPAPTGRPILLWGMVFIAAILLGGSGIIVIVRYMTQDAPRTLESAESSTTELVDVSPKLVQLALESVPRWTDASQVQKLGAKSFQFQFLGAWSPQPEKSYGRFIFVEMKVVNPASAGKAIHYISWNRWETGTGMPTAILVDSQGEHCQLASAAVGTNEALEIQPGEEVSDVLAFAYPPTPFDHVKLALSYEAIDQGRRYFGFKIPAKIIGSTPRDVEAIGEIRSGKPRSADNIPSLEEINRQLERMKQRDEKDNPPANQE